MVPNSILTLNRKVGAFIGCERLGSSGDVARPAGAALTDMACVPRRYWIIRKPAFGQTRMSTPPEPADKARKEQHAPINEGIRVVAGAPSPAWGGRKVLCVRKVPSGRQECLPHLIDPCAG